MSKALVIKNVSFAENKLATINFDEEKPCTGIVVTSDTITFTEDGQEESIGYTLTPSDTTDDVIISSDNTNVVQINNGKAICVGVGTATITIKCGTQTASIAVGSTIVMQRNWKDGVAAGKSEYGDYCQENTSASVWGYCGALEAWGDERIVAATSTPYIPVYKIPKNCGSIKIEVPSGWRTAIEFFDSTQPGIPQGSGTALLVALLVSSEPATGSAVSGDRVVNVPNGADSFAINYRIPNGNFDHSALTGYDVTFLPIS